MLDRAVAEHRVVISADTDFPQLLALSRASTPGVILFRGGDYPSAEVVELLGKVLGASAPDDLAASLCVVDRRRIRCRRLPLT